MQHKETIKTVQEFTTALLERRLGKHHYFHNLSHTQQVVEGCQIIAFHAALTPGETYVLTMAAWFHDVGYTKTYKDHELQSAEIARGFLQMLSVPPATIAQVVECILATKYPQQPGNLLENIICDADFYHFSKDDYQDHALALRKEWSFYLQLVYTSKEWDQLNYEMLKNHHYFTAYGQSVLQQQKEKNIKKLAELLAL